MISKLKTLLTSSTSRDTLVTLAGNGLVALFGMLFTILVARALAPSDFGVFSAIFALASVLGSMADLGISSALVNFIPKLPDKRNLVISVTFWLQMLVGILLILICLGLIPLRQLILPGAEVSHVLLLSLLTVAMVFEVYSQAILKAEKKFFLTSVLMTISSLSKLLLTAGLFFTSSLTIGWTLLAAVAASSLAGGIGMALELVSIKPIFPKKLARQIFQFAKWIAVTRAFSVAISRVDIVILNALVGGYQAGIFAAAGRIALLFALLVSSLSSVVAPRFSGFADNHSTKQYLKKIILLIGGISVVMAITVLFAPLIINLVFGPEYAESIGVFRALTLAMIPFLLTIITVNPLIYTYNQPDYVAKVTVVQVVVLVTLDFLLIPHFGAYAPTISLAISNLIVLGLTGYKLQQCLNQK